MRPLPSLGQPAASERKVVAAVADGPARPAAAASVPAAGESPGSGRSGSLLHGWSPKWLDRSVSQRQLLQLSEQLVTLLEAGLPIDKALVTAAMTMPGSPLQRTVSDVVVHIQKGMPFSEALRAHPRVFPRLYTNMVKAGEEGGALALVLRRVNEFMARRMEFRSFVLTASIYPTLLLLFGLGAVLGLVTFVVPKFAEVFVSMDKPMPPTAAWLIAAAEALRAHGLALLGLVALLAIGLAWLWRQPQGRYWLQQRILRLPVLGGFIQKLQFAQLTRTLGTLLAAGVPILASLRIVQGISGFAPISAALQQAAIRIKDGQAVSAALASEPLVPRLLVQLSRVGEESGALDRMMLRVAEQLELDVQRATKSFVAAFEPVMILLIGGLIGFVVVSMLLAVFALNDMPL